MTEMQQDVDTKIQFLIDCLKTTKEENLLIEDDEDREKYLEWVECEITKFASQGN